VSSELEAGITRQRERRKVSVALQVEFTRGREGGLKFRQRYSLGLPGVEKERREMLGELQALINRGRDRETPEVSSALQVLITRCGEGEREILEVSSALQDVITPGKM